MRILEKYWRYKDGVMMKTFRYRVRSEMGKITDGEMKAKSQEDLRTLLKEKGYIPLEITEKKLSIKIPLLTPGVKVKDLAIFCRQFAIVLQAGVPIATALDVLRTQSTSVTLKGVLNSIYEGMQKGVSLSASMKQQKGIFPDLLINMVEAGEVSGQLEEVFERMAETYEKETKLNSKIKASLMYPIIVAVVAALVIIVLMIFVVPNFIDILGSFNVETPKITQILIGVSDVFVGGWPYMVLGVIVLVLGIKALLKTNDGKIFFDAFMLKIPVLGGLQVKIITARFTRTLSVLLGSGVLLIQSMEVVHKIIGNSVVKKKIYGVIEDIKKGKGLYGPLQKTQFFPNMVTSMVKIGEESGELDASLGKCADFYDQEVETGLQQATSLIEPVIIIVMALVVGFIILSILFPMLSIYQNIDKM
jgi:type IV pilus assembly protein PilC